MRPVDFAPYLVNSSPPDQYFQHGFIFLSAVRRYHHEHLSTAPAFVLVFPGFEGSPTNLRARGIDSRGFPGPGALLFPRVIIDLEECLSISLFDSSQEVIESVNQKYHSRDRTPDTIPDIHHPGGHEQARTIGPHISAYLRDSPATHIPQYRRPRKG
jgi:hypothetical protein